jgi:hypothetical protein
MGHTTSTIIREDHGHDVGPMFDGPRCLIGTVLRDWHDAKAVSEQLEDSGDDEKLVVCFWLWDIC